LTTALIVGAGAVGARAARQLGSTDGVRVLVHDRRAERAQAVVESLGGTARVADLDEGAGADVAVVAVDSGHHVEVATTLLRAGTAVVSTSDDIDDARRLLDLDAEARERGVGVVVGAAFSPGLTCLLARHAANALDRVDEVHVARVGTGGPACARQRHHALGEHALDWRDGGWVRRPSGSGRELCWFPDPIGGRDCYRAATPEALLLVDAMPGLARVTARLAANRRDRVTARLPMLRRPHPEGGPGGVRVEVRGERGGARHVVVYGAMDVPAVAAGAVAARAAAAVADGTVRAGAAGLAALVDPLPLLQDLARRGVKAAAFQGG
jgi:saccharopine dehydrogenase-like NADP-dependent oxidoreductase